MKLRLVGDVTTIVVTAYYGTARVALVGLLGTVRAQGRSLAYIVHQKIVVVGAGSMAIQVVSRIAENSGAAAKNPFFLLDKYVWTYPFSPSSCNPFVMIDSRNALC